MIIHIDYAPVKNCKNPDTYGVICVKCGECGRFEYGGESNPVRSDIKIMSQFFPGIPPFWDYPETQADYIEGDKVWYAYSHSSRSTYKKEGKLEDLIPPSWIPRMDNLRWWIEGRNY